MLRGPARPGGDRGAAASGRAFRAALGAGAIIIEVIILVIIE